ERTQSGSEEHRSGHLNTGEEPLFSRRCVLLGPAIALLTLGGTARAEPATRARPSLIVEPSTGIRISGPQGGPFAPASFQYRVRASAGTVRYSIRTPSWLAASSVQGTTDTTGLTITLTLSPRALSLPPGTFGPGVAFTNATNGQGSATRPAVLVVGRPSQQPTPDPHPR